MFAVRFRLWALVSGCLLAGTAAVAEPDKAETNKFRLSIAADMKMTTPDGKAVGINADTKFAYTLVRRGSEVTVQIDALEVAVKQNGKELASNAMTKDRIVSKKNGVVESDVGPDKMTEQQKKMLAATFGTPVCKCELDATGKETKRTITAGPDAKILIDNGVISNTRLFHPMFPDDKDKWVAPAEVSQGQGRFGRGDLTYEKTEGKKEDTLVKVKVSGTLTAKDGKAANGIETRNSKYVVSGEQTYDKQKKEWVAGKLKMEVSFDLFKDDKKVASASGPLTVTLTALPEK